MSETISIDYVRSAFAPNHEDTGCLPTLLYITKQQVAEKKRDRPLHSHDSLCELLFVYRGFGQYDICNQSYPIQAGDILFYNQGDLHEVRSTLDAEIGTYCFGLTNVRLDGLPVNHLLAEGAVPIRQSGVMLDFLQQLCERAYQLLDTDLCGKAAAQCLASTILLIAHKIEAEMIPTAGSAADTRMADRIRDYLDRQFTEPVTLQSVAAAFRCSEPYISHVFKKATGYSPIQYVIRRRIGLAQTYLISSDYTATQIATLVGYDNTNYFNTLFTKIVGISPIRYKKQYLDQMRGNVTQ